MRCRRCSFDRWANRRQQRRLDAEEAERILHGEQLMENRLIRDPRTGGISEVSVPVGGPLLEGQHIRASDFNRLYERIKAIEDKLRRNR
jgi:hypothetical protein